MIRRCLLFLVVALYTGSAQERCVVTPQNRSGTCVDIYNCQPVVDVLKNQRPLTADTLDLLRRLHCGFDGSNPKVCCEQQAPPVTTTEPSIATTVVPEPPPDVANHPNVRLLNENVCGPVTQQKIFGGNKTGVFDFPWMALVAYRTRSGNTDYRCGGSLINKRYVLTAAHCVAPLPSGLTLIGVRLGEHDLTTERDCDREPDGTEIVCTEGYQDFGLESAHYHPGYDPEEARRKNGVHNDIALLRLNADADFSPQNVRPICLPIGTAATLMQSKVTVTGWGRTEYGPRSPDLLQVQLPIVDNPTCMQAYKQVNAQIWYKQMCAGGVREMDSCNGDSGGPLQAPGLYKNNVKYVQYGLVSFGLTNCGTAKIPGVYTRIVYYMDWILNTIRT